MPIPFIAGAVAAKLVLGVAAAAGATGAAKGVKGAIDTKEASNVQNKAEKILQSSKLKMGNQKKITSRDIRMLGKLKLNICSKQLKEFVELFSKIKNVQLEESAGLDELQKVRINQNELEEMKDTALGAFDVLSGSASGVGAGVLLGWGTYGGVMAIGTASTGTAIGGLSGVAATNATLAWLGGGSLTIGGGGMALGSMVLGGIVAGPALLLAGGVFGAKAKTKLNNAYSNLSEARKISEEIDLAIEELKAISLRCKQNKNLLKKLKVHFNNSIYHMENVISGGTDWNQYSKKEKQVIAMAVKYAQVIKMVIDTPMLDEKGRLTYESEEILDDVRIKKLSENHTEKSSGVNVSNKEINSIVKELSQVSGCKESICRGELILNNMNYSKTILYLMERKENNPQMLKGQESELTELILLELSEKEINNMINEISSITRFPESVCRAKLIENEYDYSDTVIELKTIKQ